MSGVRRQRDNVEVENPYQSPRAALVDLPAPRLSSRRRFWLATTAWIPLSAFAIGLALRSGYGFLLAIVLLFTAWVGAMLWVASAHARLHPGPSLRTRLILVGVGLTIALGIASGLGLALFGTVNRVLGVALSGA